MGSPPPFPDRATLEELPGGEAGTRATLGRMRDFIRAAKIDLNVRLLACAIIAGTPHKAYADQCAAVQRWVRTHIQYVRDVRGLETLTPPKYLLATRAGDCDDQAMLVAALLESIGMATRLVAGGPNPETFVHVWTEVKIGADWFACETTEPWPLGRRPMFRCYLALNV